MLAPMAFTIRRLRRIPSFFWTLKDVCFDVQPGEAVGIIGRNGAGKSTLLKMLSRITEPATGRVELRGWVGSLLEVGTGFHAELTGRENAFLSGSIFGTKKAEIICKIDEILAISEVEKFLDTPVKSYSSGMYVRSVGRRGRSCAGDHLNASGEVAVHGVTTVRRKEQKCSRAIVVIPSGGPVDGQESPAP